MAFQLNKTVENIGARRLHTVMERIMENISFEAAELDSGAVSVHRLSSSFAFHIASNMLTILGWPAKLQEVNVTKELVLERLEDVTMKADVSRYIL